MKNLFVTAALVGMMSMPMVGDAKAYGSVGEPQKGSAAYQRRQQKKNEWRNLAIGSGALSVIGLLTKKDTLTFLGAAGALYSLNRYEQDRRSQSRMARQRASFFNRRSVTYNGARYKRVTVVKNGQRYYRFVRAN